MKYVVWTTQQLAWLRENYATSSREEIEQRLAPHTWNSIRVTANNHGLRKRDWQAVCAAHKSTFDFGRSSFK